MKKTCSNRLSVFFPRRVLPVKLALQESHCSCLLAHLGKRSAKQVYVMMVPPGGHWTIWVESPYDTEAAWRFGFESRRDLHKLTIEFEFLIRGA
jgi:hypothetical protein